MSNFSDDLKSWAARHAASSADEQVLHAYAAENPAPEGQEWFIAGRTTKGDEPTYQFDLRPVTDARS